MGRSVRMGRRPSGPRRGTLRVISVIGVCGITALASCTDDPSSGPTPTIVTTTTQPKPERIDDGVLRIGALIPLSDPSVGATLNDSFVAAVDDVNAAGGVLGKDVVPVVIDEGDSAATAARAIEELVAADVDAIVGPTSSISALGALETAVAAGVVSCSATASSIALDGFPDNGLFFRSIGTDSLQAIAIARQAQETGATNIAIAHVDDGFGRPFADAVDAALGFAEVTTVAIPVDDMDLTDDVAALLEVQPQVAIVLGTGNDTALFLQALGEADTSGLTDILVNDAARSPSAHPLIAQLPESLRTRITGLAPQLVPPVDEGETPAAPFDAQIRDCVNLISLAAQQARSDAPGFIASQMSSVSAGGQVCLEFAECVARLNQRLQINYNGNTGVTDLGRNGDPERATFELFTFTEDGTDQTGRARSISVDA